MTHEVDGKQYFAIATGLTGNQMGRLGRTPELRDMAKNTTMIFVFIRCEPSPSHILGFDGGARLGDDIG